MIVLQTSKFKRDLKRYKHQKDKIAALGVVIKQLRDTGTVSAEYKPHKLHGNFQGCMECHIEDNFLLLWIDDKTNTIKLLRLGTHHEIFGL